MPTYEYVCQSCKHGFELFVPISKYMDAEKKKCPECGKKKVKLCISMPVVSYQRGEFLRKCPMEYRERRQQIMKSHPGHKMRDK